MRKSGLLSCVEVTANRDHYCTTCETRIFAGDRYERSVFLRKNGRHYYVRVYKEHLNPACPYKEPTDEDSAGSEETIPMKLAA